MSAFVPTDDGRVLARFSRGEKQVLLSLSRQLAGLLGAVASSDRGADEISVEGSDDGWQTDPALQRLFPDAYRDDVEASEEFRRFTQRELATSKVEAALAVEGALDAERFPSDARLGILIDADAAWSWLRHLTDLRLTIAARLGIVDDPHAFDADLVPEELSEEELSARGVFDWLGSVQELLIVALEEVAEENAERTDPPVGAGDS